MVARRSTLASLFAVLSACHGTASDSSGFLTAPVLTTSSVPSTGGAAAESAGSGGESSSTSTAVNSSGESSSGGTTQIFDLGSPLGFTPQSQLDDLLGGPGAAINGLGKATIAIPASGAAILVP